MFSRNRYAFLNVYHVLIDALFDTVPILLAVTALAFGNGAHAEQEIGLIMSLGTLFGTVAGLCTPVFSRMLGFPGTMALLLGCGGVGFIGTGCSGNFVTVGACCILAVSGYTVFHNLVFSFLTLHTERSRLGRAISNFTAIGDIGRIPLVSLAAFASAHTWPGLSDLPGWRLIGFLYGGVAFCLAVQLARHAALRSRPAAPPATPVARLLPSFALLKDNRIRLCLWASLLHIAGNGRIFALLPLLLLAKGLSAEIFGSFTLGFTVGSCAGKVLCGRFVDRFGSKPVFIVAELLTAALLLILVTAHSVSMIALVALLLGGVTKGTVPVIHTIITEPITQIEAYDDIFAVNSFFCGIINMLTPLLFGLTASAVGMPTVYCIMAGLSAAAVLPVALLPTRPTDA